MKPVITIVGCGPGAKEYLTVQAIEEVNRAEILIGAERALALFEQSPAQRVVLRSDLEEVLATIEASYREKRVVVLTTGDPALYSIAKPILARFGPLNCKIIAGVSSVQLAFAKLGLDWSDARIISAHHQLPELNIEEMKSASRIAVLMGHDRSFLWLQGFVGELKTPYRIVVCEDLSGDRERISEIQIADLTAHAYSRRSIVILINTRRSL